MQQNTLVEAKNIHKSFGVTKALVDVSFTLRPGEIHGLIGENGSGKSTLSSIIAGVQKYDSGEMKLAGQSYSPSSVLEGNSKGVSILLQEQGTFDNISVAANIFVGHEDRFASNGVLNLTKFYKAARDILDEIGAVHINEKAKTAALPFEDRKLVELARAMYFQPNILIADETTTALDRGGRDILYKVINKLRESGKGVIFISHDIDEIMNVCDYLTVLRDGKFITTLEKQEFESGKIKQLMVGREIGENFYRSDYKASRREEVAIEVKDISYGLLKDVSLKLHYGEIVGIGGLTDCGMHDLGKIMFGLIQPDRGCVSLGNGKIIKNQLVAIKNRIGYISKDRDKEALMMNASIKDNICLPSMKKLEKFKLIFNRSEKAFTDEWVNVLSIKTDNINQHVMYLSGGNKQKVSVSKWMGFDSEIFIFDCPTRGIDVGVKSAIYKLMMKLKEEGKAILMISEELSELIGMSDRTLILKNGELKSEFQRDEVLTEGKLIEYMI